MNNLGLRLEAKRESYGASPREELLGAVLLLGNFGGKVILENVPCALKKKVYSAFGMS